MDYDSAGREKYAKLPKKVLELRDVDDSREMEVFVFGGMEWAGGHLS